MVDYVFERVRFLYDLISQTGPKFANYRDWLDLMRSTIIKYRHKDLFHVDEMTMYSDILPSEISPNGSEDSKATESPRNQITILMSCNSSGTTKLPLLICGPYSSKITVKEHVYVRIRITVSGTSYLEIGCWLWTIVW